MSLTKRYPHFDALMEEARRYDELSHERYREETYLDKMKKPERFPVDDEHKNGESHNTMNHGTRNV